MSRKKNSEILKFWSDCKHCKDVKSDGVGLKFIRSSCKQVYNIKTDIPNKLGFCWE